MKEYECALCNKTITYEGDPCAVIDNAGNMFCDKDCFVEFYENILYTETEREDFEDDEENEQ